MSLERPVEVDCPECGQCQTTIVWDSLNAQVSPEARKALFEGKINVFVCESCGAEAMLSLPLMYHDMMRRFVVQFYPYESLAEESFVRQFDAEGKNSAFLNAFGEGVSPDVIAAMNYMKEPHVVFNMGELVRYVQFRERVFDQSTG